MKLLDKDGLLYTLNKLFKLCGNTEIILPNAIYTNNSEETIKSMVMSALSVNSQLTNLSKNYNNTVLFYAADASGFVKTDNSEYMGCGIYCGNGASSVDKSIGILQVYIMESNGTTLDFKIKNNKGTLSIL